MRRTRLLPLLGLVARVTLGSATPLSTNVYEGRVRFQARRDYATEAGPRSVAIGDLNGDGKRDLATANFGEGETDTMPVLLNRPGLCSVQDVTGTTLQTAKRAPAHANCRVGRVRRTYSKAVKRSREISQKSNVGAVLQGGGKVNLVVSRGRKPS
jgi:FG-GAP repeat